MRVLLWFLLVCGIVAVIALAVLAIDLPSGSLLLLAALLVWPLVGVATLLFVVALIRAAWRGVGDAFGRDAVSRLLSGGIVALVFSGTLQTIFSALMSLFFDLFSQVPRSISNAWTSTDVFKRCAEQQADLLASGACLQPVLGGLVFPGAEALARFGNRIAGLDIAMLVAACAVWALLGQLLSAAMAVSDQPGARSRWTDLMGSFADRQSPLRANLMLLAIIACGAMLSAAALIAIPVISDSAPLSDKDIQQMQNEVDAVLKSVDALPEGSPVEGKLAAGIKALRADFEPAPPAPGSPVPPVSGPVAAAAAAAAAVAAAEAQANARQPAVRVAAVYSQLARDADFLEIDARRVWLAVRDSASRQLGDLKGTAHDLIQRQNLAATNLRSKSGYLLDVKNWVASSVRATMRQATMCRAIIEDTTGNFLRDARYELEAARELRDTGSPRSLIDRYRTPATMTSTCTGYTTSRTPDVATLPALGPFSFAAWLITLSSISLTLVTGMLGFGLLGASISSVVRNREGRKENEPLVKDLSELLIRGMSATIVVYLAVKGGLAIFAGTSAPEPNPYVLLLTCFVASVFSDDVWTAAKLWLRSKLSGAAGNAQEKNRPGAGHGDGAVAHPPATDPKAGAPG